MGVLYCLYSSCGYRTPYDKKSGKWHPYLYHGTKYGSWFIAKCSECGTKSKLKGLIWVIIGGAIVGVTVGYIASASSSVEASMLSMPFLIILGVVFMVTILYFSISWVPYSNENT